MKPGSARKTFHSSPSLCRFPQTRCVTSNLATRAERVDDGRSQDCRGGDCRGGDCRGKDCRDEDCRDEGGTGERDRKRGKSFVVKILTSKPLALKILPRIGRPKVC